MIQQDYPLASTQTISSGQRCLTFGVFDLFHYGHVELFRRIKEYCGVQGKLIVAVQDGEFIQRFKPEAHIIYSTFERQAMVEQCRYVDEAVLYQTVDQGIRDIPFDVLLLGTDQGIHGAWQTGLAWCKEHHKTILRIPRTPGISSSDLRERIAKEIIGS